MTKEESKKIDAAKVLEKYSCEFEVCFSLAALIAHEFGFKEQSLVATKKVFSYNPNNKLVTDLFPELREVIDEIGKVVDAHGHLLEKDPEKEESWKILGHCFLTLSDFPNAFAAYGHALTLDPGSQDLVLLYGMAVIYEHFGYNENAISLFSKVLRLDPNFVFESDIRFRLGILYRNVQRFDRAIDCFASVAEHPPNQLKSEDVAFQLAFTRQCAGELERAISEYEGLMEQNPSVTEVAQQFLLVLVRSERPVAVVEAAVERVMKNHSADPTVRLLAGRFALKNGDCKAAYHHYSYCIPYFQDEPMFWASMGVLYFKNEQLSDALLAFQRALALKSQILEAWLNIGLIQILQNEYANALATYQTGLEKCQDSSELTKRMDQLRRNDRDPRHFPLADVKDGELVVDIPSRVAVAYGSSVPPLPSACFSIGENAELFAQLSIPCPSLFDA